MKYSLKLLAILITSFFSIIILSCTEIVDPDIRNNKVVLLSPPDSLRTVIATQTFWWEEVEFADEYDFQLVSPSFEYIERIFIESTLEITKFDYTMIPGEYQWRVRAKNYSYETEYFTHTLYIDSTNDISQETIQLLSPVDYDTTNQTTTLFRWVPLYNADNYNFQLYYTSQLVYYETTIYDNLTLVLSYGDGSYEWKIRGQNEFSNTAYSSRYLYIDTTPPSAPVLIKPPYNSQLNDTIIHFEWERGRNMGSSIKDSLIVYTDSLLFNIKLEKQLTDTFYNDSLGPGSYFWHVRSFDAAGNISNYSSLWKFTILSKIEK